MKKVLVFLSAIMTTSIIMADEPSTEFSNEEKSIELTIRRHPSNNRPKAPSMQKIRCLYQDGWISIEFEIDEGMAELDVIDLATGFGSSQLFSTSAPAKLYVGKLNGPTQLVVNTAAGQSYEGFIY